MEIVRCHSNNLVSNLPSKHLPIQSQQIVTLEKDVKYF